MATGKERLPLAVHRRGDRFEVGVTNLFGGFRLENFMEIPDEVYNSGVDEEELCEAYIAHMQAASEKFWSDRYPTKHKPRLKS